MEQSEGLIIKGVGGFYMVETAEAVYECKARGIFRKEKICPLPGDHVLMEPDGFGKGWIIEILPRKNMLLRPRVANLDKLFVVSSVAEPLPNTLVMDKTIAIAEKKDIQPVIVVTKTDLDTPDPLCEIYEKAGFCVICFSITDRRGIEKVKQELIGCVSAFTGNSGVGKSTLLNALGEGLSLPTGDISKKLGRGRHTTRHVELYKLQEGGYVADTPGFSSVDIERSEVILKDELEYCFREFAAYRGTCRFTGCSHTSEKGCGIIQAVKDGKISTQRHGNYVEMYNEVKNIREWEISN